MPDVGMVRVVVDFIERSNPNRNPNPNPNPNIWHLKYVSKELNF